MDNSQERLTDEEMESLQDIVSNTLASVCAMADKHNIDRDSMLKYFAGMLTTFAEVASIQNYKVNHTCNCKHNRNSNSDEPCCRCDSRMTNADRIRSMSDEELAEMFDRLDRTCIRDFINHINDNECEARECKYCKKEFPVLNWLQSPVDNEVSDLENFEVRR